MRWFKILSVASCGAVCAGAILLAMPDTAQTQDRTTLQAPAAFDSIQDKAARSRALFTETAKVYTHPRCMNCHPATDRLLQGNDSHPHMPLASRGDPQTGRGATSCGTCHSAQNVELRERASFRSIPGNPRWAVAPIEMAWEGKSIGDICRQLKDKNRNGGRDLAALHEHVAHDELVGWGWNPGTGRDPAPGSQELMGKLVQAWIDTGAECPQ